ncbi:MAG: homoserine O-succinyltransferase, partial [Caulobacterales bacterium]|nr:homoserine O-succinyltransferase [Caulobacterales bacterium]
AGPAIVALGGISGSRHVAEEPGGRRGWWAEVVRAGGGLDLDRYAVMGVDYAPADVDAPVPITPADQARLLALALDAAGVERVHAIVGASYGGMVGLSFARLFPERIDRLAVISAAHRPSAMATAWRGVQRRILEFAAEVGRPEEGVALARQLAMTTYRSPEEFAERFRPGLTGDAPTSEACEYLIARGAAYRGGMSPARFTSLSAAIDRHWEEPEAITTPTLLVAADTDRLIPAADMAELRDRLAGPARLVILNSLFGHDAFLKEADALRDPLQAFLGDGPAA